VLNVGCVDVCRSSVAFTSKSIPLFTFHFIVVVLEEEDINL
jgi:hypothetical protein